MPRISPAAVLCWVMVGDSERLASVLSASHALASPKSSTLTVPSGRSLMLAGLRSRWTMPCSCAASRASAIWRAMGIASSAEIGPARDSVGEVFAFDELHDQGRVTRPVSGVERPGGCKPSPTVLPVVPFPLPGSASEPVPASASVPDATVSRPYKCAMFG